MKIAPLLLAALEVPFCAGTTTTTKKLRGGKVTHVRTVHHPPNLDHRDFHNPNLRAEPLVVSRGHPRQEQEIHHYVEVQGKNKYGETRNVILDLDELEEKMPHDSPIFKKNDYVVHEDDHVPHSKTRGIRGGANTPKKMDQNATRDTLDSSTQPRRNHHSHRNDQDLHHHSHEHHFEVHEEVERHHDHHYDRHHVHQKRNTTSYKMTFGWEATEHHYNLPTGFPFHFNETLFEKLHNAPFVVYEEALGHKLEDDESFPVFALPKRVDTTGVFTGFSKFASPLLFETIHFLSSWEELQDASDAVIPEELEDHMSDCNFHASLIVGKSVGDLESVSFLGIAISYFQYGREKNVLVPFSKVDDFFDETSEKHLMNPATKGLEMAELHHLLEEKQANSSNFNHPALVHTEQRKKALEDLDSDQFHKRFHLLIRRAYLFSYGYADCLLNQPEGLRQCLDDTFYHLIEMETEVRGALDDEVLQTLVDINHTFHSKVSEACIATQGSGTGVLYGSGSCYTNGDLGAFVNMGVPSGVHLFAAS